MLNTYKMLRFTKGPYLACYHDEVKNVPHVWYKCIGVRCCKALVMLAGKEESTGAFGERRKTFMGE